MSAAPTGKVYLLNAGDRIGPYVVTRPLGAGGMGQVYLVEHQQLRKRYALKILPAELASEADFIDRFRIEARVMADLEHAGIVRVHNFGEENGRYYLVMDYVEGPDGAPRTLDDELAWGKKLPERVALSIARQLCDALHYAHQFPGGAIIHRDLKPSNILLSRAGADSGRTPVAATATASEPEFRVKIADFGLAKIVGTDYVKAVIDRSASLTAMPARASSPESMATECDAASSSSKGSILGTYDYMSPEQKTGVEVDARSDIYALGLILYRMITGHKPEGTYEPPSKSGVNRRWDAIIAKCLQRDLNKRYGSVDLVRRDLEVFDTPMHRQRWFPVLTAAGAALVVGLTLHLTGRPDASVEPVRRTSIYTEADKPFLLTYRVKVKPAGANLVIRRDGHVVVESPVHRWWGAKVKLKPGVYNFSLTRPGYRTVSIDLPVSEDDPDEWTVRLEKVFGFVRITAAPEARIAILDRSGKQVREEPVDRQGDTVVFKLPQDRYEVVITRSNHVAMSRVVELQENRPVDIKADLVRLPGQVLIESGMPAEVWLNGKLAGRTGEWITQVPSGTNRMVLRREGYRPLDVEVEVPPNGQASVRAGAMQEFAASAAIRAEVAFRDVAPEHVPTKGLLRVGGAEAVAIDLPATVEIQELGKPLALSLAVEGYREARPITIRFNDGEVREVVFRLQPEPTTFPLTSAVPARIYQKAALQSGQGWRKMLFGNVAPIGVADQPLVLDTFVKHELTAVLEGYRPFDFTLYSTTPGGVSEPVNIAMERFAPATITFDIQPTNAVLLVGGVEVSERTLEMPSATNIPVNVSLPGHLPIKDGIVAEPGETRTIRYKLKRVGN